MKIYVEKIRIEKGLSVRELSRMSDVAASHIINIENGNRAPTITILCKLARALNVHCNILFSYEQDDNVVLLPCDIVE